MKNLNLAINNVGPTPCEAFRCRCIAACAEGPRACASFREYVADNALRPTRDDPSKAMYRSIYTREDR